MTAVGMKIVGMELQLPQKVSARQALRSRVWYARVKAAGLDPYAELS